MAKPLLPYHLLENTFFVWDMNSGHWLHSIKDGGLMDFVLSPDGKSITTKYWDETVKIWDYPQTDIRRGFEETGLQSLNYRVCRETLKYSIVPFLQDSSVWADPKHCKKNLTIDWNRQQLISQISF